MSFSFYFLSLLIYLPKTPSVLEFSQSIPFVYHHSFQPLFLIARYVYQILNFPLNVEFSCDLLLFVISPFPLLSSFCLFVPLASNIRFSPYFNNSDPYQLNYSFVFLVLQDYFFGSLTLDGDFPLFLFGHVRQIFRCFIRDFVF